MGWKWVAWAGCLVPVLAGCGSLRHAATADPDRSETRRGIARDQRRDARAAWQAVRAGHTARAFSDEFRDGFHDGYADYLDRGDAAHPPAVPPNRYARGEAHTAPDGQSLMRDYYSGFDYGKGTAVASGRRAGDGGAPPPVVPYVPAAPTGGAKPTAAPGPAPLPPPRPVNSDSAPGANKFDAPDKTKPADPPPRAPGPPDGAGPPVPPLPKPEVPVIKPFNPAPPDDLGTKFGPVPVPPDPDRLPAPNPPLPVPLPTPLPVPADPIRAPGAAPLSVLSDVPVIPFRFPAPPVIPAGAAVPRK